MIWESLRLRRSFYLPEKPWTDFDGAVFRRVPRIVRSPSQVAVSEGVGRSEQAASSGLAEVFLFALMESNNSCLYSDCA